MTEWRDARLARALEHAPDAQDTPGAATRAAILRQAHAAVASPAIRLAATPLPQRPAWWKKWLGLDNSGGGGRPWNAAFASVLLAGVVTSLWWQHEVPGPVAEPGSGNEMSAPPPSSVSAPSAAPPPPADQAPVAAGEPPMSPAPAAQPPEPSRAVAAPSRNTAREADSYAKQQRQEEQRQAKEAAAPPVAEGPSVTTPMPAPRTQDVAVTPAPAAGPSTAVPAPAPAPAAAPARVAPSAPAALGTATATGTASVPAPAPDRASDATEAAVPSAGAVATAPPHAASPPAPSAAAPPRTTVSPAEAAALRERLAASATAGLGARPPAARASDVARGLNFGALPPGAFRPPTAADASGANATPQRTTALTPPTASETTWTMLRITTPEGVAVERQRADLPGEAARLLDQLLQEQPTGVPSGDPILLRVTLHNAGTVLGELVLGPYSMRWTPAQNGNPARFSARLDPARSAQLRAALQP